MSPPVVIRGDGPRIFEFGDGQDSRVLFLHLKFEIAKKELQGYIALFMNIPSIDELRSLIGDFVVSIAEKKSSASASTTY